MRLRLKGALRLMSVENLSTGSEASATGESLNSGDPAVHPAARHNIDWLLRVLLEEFRRRNLDLKLALASTRTRGEGSSCGSCKGRLACV